MTKSNRKSKKANYNFIFTLVLALLALAYFVSQPSHNDSSNNSSERISKSPGTANTVTGPEQNASDNELKLSEETTEDLATLEQPSKSLNNADNPSTDLPEDMKNQLESPPPTLPADLQAQLDSPPPPLPPDLEAQLNSPPPELPEDIKRAIDTPPRIVTIEEVNTPPEDL